ncbi:hypothetical protein [Caldimonas brevitalea]|uniref:Secreted protein n=1 Tax=Caldimonas brevitalea TaxID=413882 RepID=A0A0G3BX90_9BURK|nr:hypothetical protein [Caldimonas brevitalea]AKJ31986.1 hypothetical protein AAW51_5295 [Caldimonas brevitalea]
MLRGTVRCALLLLRVVLLRGSRCMASVIAAATGAEQRQHHESRGTPHGEQWVAFQRIDLQEMTDERGR